MTSMADKTSTPPTTAPTIIGNAFVLEELCWDVREVEDMSEVEVDTESDVVVQVALFPPQTPHISKLAP